ncbi:hypothetical protein [Streptoalloteichus hindustanus]|uniref:Uncharacterized protein n=1 Tax=Streptoalloteichus hindustanus TaxID=2017 RepID=A0A1M5GF13_STRHI|nr:hypothetical protein [Streptoalloteichus hindustanus]SHG02286.1 hypothetical protein SAMN05444320_10693 [Streptoalloteichus hindustanus]
MTDRTATPSAPRRAGLFDLRWIIGFLFAVYGVVLTVLGLGFTTDADVAKAAGVNINLWSGLAMLATALVFGLWAKLRPLAVPAPAPDELPEPPPGVDGHH